jgi:hypothetical protein
VQAFIDRIADRLRLAQVADWLAVGTAASLPWSTSGTSILSALLLLAIIPTLDWASLRRELTTAAGGLPVLLVALGMVGTLWADVGWHDRWGGLTSFLRLLAIPLLFVHFRTSQRGWYVFAAYAASCAVLLPLTSFIHSSVKGELVLVKNGATQSGEFVLCIFGLLFVILECIERRRWWWIAGCAAVILGMLANMAFVATGRTALVVMPVLLMLFAVKKLSGKATAFMFAGVIVVAVAAWFSSPYLRYRTTELWTGYQQFKETNTITSSGQRVLFYLNSLQLIREAPVFGHGTGSIGPLFERIAKAHGSPEGWLSNNPHNQTFAVAVQIGVIGAGVLWAMWIAHLMLFRGNGLPQWVGLIVVVQNIVGSAFNSHLFDFDQAWTYILGVGVAGGMVLAKRAAGQALAEKR